MALEWQRSKYFKGKFHLPRDDNRCSHDWHYFPTLCRDEIKSHNWEIEHDPDKRKCCRQCLAIAKERGWL